MADIHPGKAFISLAIALLMYVALPYYVVNNLLPVYAPGIVITDDMLNGIVLFGIIGGVLGFFQVLFEPGTRPHGLFNAGSAAYGTYYLYLIFAGGFGGEFGVFGVSFGGYFISVNIIFIAYVIIGAGALKVLLYLYEMLA